MLSNSGDPYWLFDWLESNGVRDRETAHHLLTGKTVELLKERAQTWSDSFQTPREGHNLVAGTGLRLNDDLSCPSSKCRQHQVNILFRHAWHYFDQVLLPDGFGELVLTRESLGWSDAHFKEILLNQIEVALHIRNIGAEQLITYYPVNESKRHGNVPVPIDGNLVGACTDAAWAEIEARMGEKGRFQLDYQPDGGCQVFYFDPDAQYGTSVNFSHDVISGKDEDWIRSSMVHDMLHFHISALERDMSASRSHGASLGTCMWSHASALGAINGGPDTSNVMFELDLPSLSHIPIEELLAFRVTEQDSFVSFRSALQKAAQTMLGERASAAPKEIARAIRMDIVDPEIARLNTKLKAAQRAMQRKTLFSVALTAVSTACGLFVAGDLGALGGAGLGVLASNAIGAASRYCDVKAEIESSDMFFIWKALGHAE